MKRTIALIAGLALVLSAGCGDKLPTDIPDVLGYDGIVAQGWQALSSDGTQILSIERFGLSAPGAVAADHLEVSARSLRQTLQAAGRKGETR